MHDIQTHVLATVQGGTPTRTQLMEMMALGSSLQLANQPAAQQATTVALALCMGQVLRNRG